MREAQGRVEWLKGSLRVAGPLLDVGAGSGAFCAAAAQAGLEAVGVDPSPVAVERAARVYGARLTLGSVSSLPARPTFAAVTLWDVVEHVRDPLGLLNECRERLLPGGLLVLETGNYESAARLRAGSRWGLFLFDHMFYFAPASLHALTTRAGFSSFALASVPQGPGSPATQRPVLARMTEALRHPLAMARRLFFFPIADWRARTRWPDHFDREIMVATAVKP